MYVYIDIDIDIDMCEHLPVSVVVCAVCVAPRLFCIELCAVVSRLTGPLSLLQLTQL